MVDNLGGPVHLIAPGADQYDGISRYCRELYERLQGTVPLRLCSFRPPPLAGVFTFLRALPLGVEPDERRGIYHFTRIMGCSLMLWRPVHPAVATVHDMGQLVWDPERRAASRLDRLLLRLSLVALKRMDRILARSNYTKRTLCELLPVDPNRVHVTSGGIDTDRFYPVPRANAKLEQRYGVVHSHRVYDILYVGTEIRRKNLGLLLRAMAYLRDRGVAVRLIKVGGPGDPEARRLFLSQVHQLGLSDLVLLAGWVSEADLPAFYTAADVVVVPSLVEGLGLPVLEAMACGTPVVCSNAGALPEVVGDAALLVRPDDVPGLANALAAVFENGNLREQLSKRGLERARAFTWAETAEQTRNVYQELLGQSQPGPGTEVAGPPNCRSSRDRNS